MRMQLTKEQLEYYASVPRELKELWVEMSSSYPPELCPPGVRPVTSVEDFEKQLQEPDDIVSNQAPWS